MPVTIAYPHIAKAGHEPARLERLPRIRVADVVLPHLVHGWSADELHRQYPHLTLGEIHSCLGYYFDNAPEVEAVIAAESELASQLRDVAGRTKLGLRLRELKAR
jgi:hypothetical protein